MPLIKTFAKKLVGNTLSDDNIFRYFMVVALSTFLCPNSSTLPSPKYLGALIDVSTVKNWDWSKFVFEWLFASISLYRKKQRRTIGGCIYFFAVCLFFHCLFLVFQKRLCIKVAVSSFLFQFKKFRHASSDDHANFIYSFQVRFFR